MINPHEELRKAHHDVLAGIGDTAFNAHAKSTFPNYIPNASVSTAQGHAQIAIEAQKAAIH